MKACLWCVLLAVGSVVRCCAVDRNAFTFTNYSLDVRVEPEQQRLEVRGRVTLRNDSRAPLKNAVLQISSSLDWRSIQVDGKPVQFLSQPYTSDIDHTGAVSEAIVSLPTAIAPKTTVDLDIGYEGVVPLDTTRLKRIGVPEEVAKHSDWDQISASFTAVRGVGHVAWYPVAMDAANLSEGNSAFEVVADWKKREESAGMRVNLCVMGTQAAETVLMNEPPGEASGTKGGGSQGEGTTCSEHLFVPLGITAPAFTVGGYERVAGVAATVYYLSANRLVANSYLAAVERVLPFVRSWFGQSRSAQNVVQLADPDAAPFETGSIVFTPLAADTKLAEISVVHQVTHTAFPSPRAWIYEGLAHFAQALWREHESGRQAALDFMGLHRTALADVERAENQDSDSRSLISSANEEIYRSKAMFVWWMLRDMIDEPTLKKALAAYRPSEDHDPSYLPSLIQAQSRRDLQWFFDDWIYHDRGLPDFRVASVYPSKTPRGIYLLTVTIENLGNAGAEVPFTVRFEGGEVTKRLEVRAKSQATTRVEVPAMPEEVVVNDGSVPESNPANNAFKVGAK